MGALIAKDKSGRELEITFTWNWQGEQEIVDCYYLDSGENCPDEVCQYVVETNREAIDKSLENEAEEQQCLRQEAEYEGD